MEGLIRVRRMTAADLPAVLAIQAASREAAQWTADSYRPFLSEDAEPATPTAPVESVGWVANVGAGLQTAPSELTGFLVARFLPGECEILNVAVSPGARRRGAGGALVRQALATAAAWGAKAVWLEVRESNAAAIAFYQRYGFERTGTRPGYYQSPVEGAVILSRTLQGGL